MSSANASADVHRGRRVGKYEILTRLSMGGMAELFLAFLPGPGGFKKFVALKQILPDVKADEAFVKMFLDEARITAAFSHANIGQVFDLGEDPDNHEFYLAMEFIAGQNLEQTVKRAAKKETAIPVEFAARVIRDTCLALHYAHHFVEPSTGQPMPVVHRDVSPKNVMVTYSGDVKVIDFGIAKARGRLNRTQVGVVKGTSGYMSPEQVRNEPLDGRSDLFATAVMLWELLAGERLFVAPTDAAMMLKIVEGEVPPVTSLSPDVPPALAEVVAKGLAKSRDKRFATGKEFARAIEQALPGLAEEEEVGALMSQLFEDKVAITRSLFELAKNSGDEAGMSRAVEELRKDEGESSTPKPRKATNPKASGSATPRPGQSRGLPKAPARSPSVQGLPKVPSNPGKAAGSVQSLNKVGSGPKSQQQRQARGEEPTNTANRIQRSKSGTGHKAGGQPRQAGPPTDPRAPAQTELPPGGNMGLLAGLAAVLVVLAVAGWAVTMGPLKEQAKQWLQQPEERKVDTGPKPIDLSVPPKKGGKPAWVIEKEKQELELAAERERQRQIEEAASDPESLKVLEEIQARLAELNHLEEEQRQLKIEAKAGTATGAANTKKIEDMQKQIDDLKSLIQRKQDTAAARRRRANGEVEVVRDARSAKNADVGYFTLRTINPQSAAVSEGGSALGSTPLIKVPLDTGLHRLLITDAEGKRRVLSMTVEGGKTTEFKAVDVSSLPLAK